MTSVGGFFGAEEKKEENFGLGNLLSRRKSALNSSETAHLPGNRTSEEHSRIEINNDNSGVGSRRHTSFGFKPEAPTEEDAMAGVYIPSLSKNSRV
jgi:hypothetical protein